jgi:hypothetical protein
MTSQFLKLRIPLQILAAAVLIMGSFPSSTRAGTTNFYLANAGSGANLAGVYTSPYTGSVTGPTGTLIPVICDDFANESYVPEDWTAYVTPYSSTSLNNSTDTQVLWTGASYDPNPPSTTFNIGIATYNDWNLTQAQAYTVAAVLAIAILNNTGTLQQDYSYALWELFDPSQVVSWLGSSYQSTLMAATSDVEAAITAAAGLTPASFPNVTVYSYESPNQGGQTPECGNPLAADCATVPPQEFIVVTPEPASLLLFGTGLLGLFTWRKRMCA